MRLILESVIDLFLMLNDQYSIIIIFLSIAALTHRDASVKWAAAGDHVTMTVTGVDVAHVRYANVKQIR